jgi:5'-AMP-activated protein kinase catalytic alpha subunit
VAVKIIDKSKLTDPNEAKRIQREIRVMRHLTHECIVKLFEVRTVVLRVQCTHLKATV